MQQVDDPPYLSVGTEVSAKYKGAFCEAKVRKVVRNIKCKVAYKQGGSGTVSDEQIKSELLRVGGTVEVKHPDRKELVEATITKIQDCSQYTVVFDDGDITTLRRSALCLKSGRHFNESETLDQLPLTHPEHFGNPVIGGRRGRRGDGFYRVVPPGRYYHPMVNNVETAYAIIVQRINLDLNKKNVIRSRHMPDDSTDEEDEAITAKQRIIEKEEHIGKVVCVENTETKKKSSKENWFPALVVAPTAQDTVRIRVKDEYLVRSFKDGRYYTVPKKEATDFTKDKTSKQDSDAVQAALEYMHKDSFPPHWDRDVLFGLGNCSSDFEGDYESDTSDDEPREEKDHFVAQLYKYMDDRGTPLNKGPSITNKDVDLYRLFRAVQKLGGYNRVTTQSQWKQIATRLGYTPTTTSIQNLVKQAYKKFLLPFEEFDRKLGCTMVAHPRANRIKGRNLVRAHSVASPKPDKEIKAATVVSTAEEVEISVEPVPEKTKRKLSTSYSGKVKAMVEKYEEKVKEKLKEVKTEIVEVKEEPPKVKEKDVKKITAKEQKDVKEAKQKEVVSEVKVEKNIEPTTQVASSTKKIKEEIIPATPTIPPVPSPLPTKKEKAAKRQPTGSDEKKPAKKRKVDAEPDKSVEKPEKETATVDFPVEVGDKLKVYYHEQKHTYEAKVIEISVQQGVCLYLVHYTGWNTRYDEWVPRERIAENLTNSKTIKRSKTGNSRTSSTNSDRTSISVITNAPAKPGMRKGRGGSRADSQPPRSTTPSSIASNSSRTKSPATPAQRRTTRAQPNAIRRTSNNTDISSVQTDDTDSDSDEPVKIPPKRKIPFQRSQTQPPQLPSSSGLSKTISNPSSEEESTGTSNKGRDFDLNQIRSELKGFKELKSPANEVEIETDSVSTNEKKMECPSTSSNAETDDYILQDITKTETSDLSSECDSYGDDDSQFSDKTTTLENISESLQEKFKAGKLDTDVFKKTAVDPNEFVEKMAVLKASGIEKIIKNSLADRSKALPEKMTMKALCERSPLKQKDKIKEKDEKLPAEIKLQPKAVASDTKLSPNIERNTATKVEKVVSADKSLFKTVFDKTTPSKSTFEKTTPVSPTDSFLTRTAIADFSPAEKTSKISTPSPQAACSASDIYEFKEPEPFEFETVKKLSPEIDKKAKKKSVIDLVADSKSFATSTTSTTTATTPVKKFKKSPSKEIDPKPKQKPDDPILSPTVTSPPASLVPPKVESIFDSLRKSPSFNINSVNPNMPDDLYVLTSQKEPLKSEIPTTAPKTSFANTFFESSKSVETAKIFDVKPGVLEKEDDDNDKSVELETAKKILLADEVFELNPPKIDKPSSIADKVLKALNKQQQQQRQENEDNVSELMEHKEHKPGVYETDKVEATLPINSDVKIDAVVEQLVFEPPKIDLNTHIKKESENQPKKPVLSSPEHKLDILESIAPKNNDLSETIQKLESVIQHSADMGQMSDDSSDSTDSEQRLIIEDESQSSETQNEFNKGDSQHFDLNKQVFSSVVERKIFENQMVDDSVATTGVKFAIDHFAAQQPKAKPLIDQSIAKTTTEILVTYSTIKSIPQAQPHQVDALKIKEEPDEETIVENPSVAEATHNESLQLLLCEETIPGSPAPARDVFTHSMDTDTNTVPMELDVLETKVIKSDNVSPTSSRHDSLSHDDSSEDVRKTDQDEISTRRRRRSKKLSESEAPAVAIKRRKATSRRNTATGSDSEDNAENVQRFSARQPIKPCQYNFLVQLDPSLNSHQRITILNKKIQDLRKTYNMLKTELASIDRRRKKLRRRERENKKQQQMKLQQSIS